MSGEPRAARGRRAVARAGQVLATVALAMTLLAACGEAPYLPGPEVVARLGEEEVRQAEFEAYLARNVGAEAEALPSAALSGLFDQFVHEELLVRLSRDRGVSREGEPARRAIDALLAADGPLTPARAAIEAYYREHLAEYRLPERVRLRQLLATDRATAERARRELAAGAPFDEVVRRGAAGGKLEAGVPGELSHDELPSAFADLVFRLQAGGTSEVVEAEYGFHVFQVESRLPARTAPLEEVASAVEREVAGLLADRRLAALVQEAKQIRPPAVYDRNLPFEYRGSLPVSRPYEKH